MSKLIAVSGKGGVGKTTISALLVKQLIAQGKEPVLAIDADPNSCLDTALGVSVEHTVGSARESVRVEAQDGRSGIAKQELLQLKIAESLVESRGFDLIAMGRPEGAGCYCFANNVLKSVIQAISNEYPYVVLDNEAGLENLSRRIVAYVDILVLVSDPSNAGLRTLSRLYDLAREMHIQYDKLVLVVNRKRSDKHADIDEVQVYTKADQVIEIPDDAEIAAYAEDSRSLLELSGENPVLQCMDAFIKTI